MAYTEGQTATNPQTGEKIVFRGGQWEPLQAQPAPQAPSPPAFIPGAVSPSRQAADERAAREDARAQARFDRDMMGGEPPSGYRYTGDGNLEFIPGGPADPAVSLTKPGKALRQGDSDKLRAAINQFASFTSINDTFNDDFGGNWLGGVENVAQGYSPVPVGTPGQRDWWSSLYEIDNIIRNDLFGASLTQGEKQAYARTTVTPGMNANEIRKNLARREEIMRGALSRYVEGLKAGGWSAQEIDALMGDISPRIFPARAATGEKTEDDDPPMLATRGGLQAADGRIAGLGDDNGGAGELQLTQGGFDQVDNPVLAGVRGEYLARLGRGDSAQEIIRWARQAGIEPRAYPSIVQQVKFRRENPAVPLSQYNTSELDDMLVPLSAGEQALNTAAQSPIGAAFMAAGDAASGFTLDNIIGATGGNAERARLGMQQVAAQNPVSNVVGTVAGGVPAALAAEQALAMRGMAAGLPRAMIADSTYGAAAGAGATDYAADGTPASLTDRATGAVTGALAAAGGSYVGQKGGNAVARMASPASDASVRAVNDLAIPTTVGQQYAQSGPVGAAIKGVEDRLSGLPIVGGVVTGRQREGVRTFNTKAFEKALEPIGGTVAGQVGEDAIASAQQQVSDAFTAALAGKGAVPDEAFARDLSAAVLKSKTIKRLGDEVTDEIGAILKPYADDGMLSGEALQDISRQLRDLKYAYRNDPLAKRVAGAVDSTERAVFDLFDRQASGTIPAYLDARRAYRRLSVLEDAVLMGKNTEGEFTPAQLGRADRRNAVRYGGKRAAARGEGEFHDFQRAAQNVLPNNVPDSGTAGRLLLPLAGAGVVGGDAYAGDGVSTTGITIAAILGGTYSKPLQRLMTKPGRGVKSPAVQGVLKSPTTRRLIGATGASGAIGTTTQQ